MTLVYVPELTGEPYEDWLDFEIEVKAGNFTGKFSCQFCAMDIASLTGLQENLERLYGKLSGDANFELFEQQLKFQITGDGLGHFQLCGVAVDKLGNGNQLHFHLEEFDQTFIPEIIRELEEVRHYIEKISRLRSK